MMDANDMIDRCMSAMGSMMGGGMKSNSIILVSSCCWRSSSCGWLASLRRGADLLGRPAVH
jgi:hypothetical protein